MTDNFIIVFRNNARFSIGYLGADGPIRIKHFSHSKKNAWCVILKQTGLKFSSLCKLKIYSINDNKQNKVKNLVRRNKISIFYKKMDPSELRMNLASLQRIDPYIAQILMASSQVWNTLFLLLSKVSSKISIWLLSYCEILILTISQWKLYTFAYFIKVIYEAVMPEKFGRSVNPIPTGEVRLSPPITAGTPNVFHLPASLWGIKRDN